MPEVFRSKLLAGMPHGFSDRSGLAVDDVLQDGALVTVKQVHEADVVRISGQIPPDTPGDAIVTDQAGLVLGIVTADCAPVLLADREAGVIGAAHAGWRGALAGVIANTVTAMEQLGARRSRILAAIGPCIAQANYEVDEALHRRFEETDHAFFRAMRPGHWQFDLPGLVAERLREAGVGAIESLGLDTYADPSRFHSYRRASHRAETTAGRQISMIALPEI